MKREAESAKVVIAKKDSGSVPGGVGAPAERWRVALLEMSP
jgi:hypothetical protein